MMAALLHWREMGVVCGGERSRESTGNGMLEALLIRIEAIGGLLSSVIQ